MIGSNCFCHLLYNTIFHKKQFCQSAIMALALYPE